MIPEEREYLRRFLRQNPSLPETKAKAILTPLFPLLKSYQETKEAVRRVTEAGLKMPLGGGKRNKKMSLR